MATLQPGEKAPHFTLERDGGSSIALTDFEGKKIVLYFYPKDNTPGCTVEAVDFTARLDQFEALNTVIIGVSPDSAASHDNFITKQALKVILAADPEKQALEAYGVWQEKMNYGRKYMGVVRTTYLISEDGEILNVWNKVKAKGHAEAVLEYLRTLD